MSFSAESIATTFFASIESVGTVIVLASAGIYLHQRKFLVSQEKKTLAKISKQVTLPLLLFTSAINCEQNGSEEECPDVASSLSDTWPLLFWPIVVVCVGLSVGYGVAWFTGAHKNPSKVRSIMCACSLGNSTGLPLTLLASIHATLGDDHDLGRVDPTLFLSVYLLLYPVIQWAVGGWLLGGGEQQPPPPPVQNNTAARQQQQDTESASASVMTGTSRGSQSVATTTSRDYTRHPDEEEETEEARWTTASAYVHLFSVFGAKDVKAAPIQAECDDDKQEDHPEQVTEVQSRNTSEAYVRLFNAFFSKQDNNEQQPQQQQQQHLEAIEEESDGSGSLVGSHVELNSHQSVTTATTRSTTVRDQTDFERHWENFRTACGIILSAFMQPPGMGALAGIIVAATPVRGILVDLEDRNGSAPLQFLFNGLYAVGRAAIPLNMMILGCNLSASWVSHQQRRQMKKRAASGTELSDDLDAQTIATIRASMLSTTNMIGIVCGKMLVMPFIGMGLVMVLQTFMNLPEEIDGAFYAVLMIVFITPTANNVMVMVELCGNNLKEGIAQTIALQYACSPVLLSMTMSLVIGISGL